MVTTLLICGDCFRYIVLFQFPVLSDNVLFECMDLISMFICLYMYYPKFSIIVLEHIGIN